MSNNPKLIFLLGLARSGTKLLRDILNNHSQISLLSIESQFITKYYKKYSMCDFRDKDRFSELYDKIQNSTYGINLKNRGEKIPNNELTEFSYADVLKCFFELSLLKIKPNATIIGDKTPRYTAEIDILIKLFPDAEFIHIVRDPRDRAVSEKKVWGKSPIKSVNSWNSVLKGISPIIKNNQKKIFELTYEELLNKPRPTVSNILEFLSLEFDHNMLTITNPSEKYGNAKNVNKIVAGNTGNYQNYFSIKKIRKLEETAFSMLSFYNYNIDFATREKSLYKFVSKGLGLYDRISLYLFHIKEKGLVKGLIYFWRLGH